MIDPQSALDAIREGFTQIEDFDDFVLAAAQQVAENRNNSQLADDIMTARERRYVDPRSIRHIPQRNGEDCCMCMTCRRDRGEVR